ncbi:MAG: DUF4249 family protein [Bacteroidales bacterium]
MAHPRFLLLFLPLIACSCENEVDVESSGDPVPVIYCLLNPDENVQCVRLGRSFLPDPANPGAPPVTDSTVWNLPVEVYVEEWNNGFPGRTILFEPGNAPVKDTGFFPTGNLRIYSAQFTPKIQTTYRLYVHFPDDGRIISASTTVPDRPHIYDPMDVPGRKINFQTGTNYTIRWLTAKGAGIYQGFFDLYYEEQFDDGLTVHQITFDSEPVLNLVSSVEDSKKVLSGANFFNQILEKVPAREGAVRRVVNLRFRFYTGGEELALYVSPELQTTTIANNLNLYSNFDNGIGLFSTLQVTYVNNLQLSNTTLNELAHGSKTRHLGFLDAHGGE